MEEQESVFFLSSSPLLVLVCFEEETKLKQKRKEKAAIFIVLLLLHAPRSPLPTPSSSSSSFMDQLFQELALSFLISLLFLYLLRHHPSSPPPPRPLAQPTPAAEVEEEEAEEELKNDDELEWEWEGVEETEAGARFRAAVKYAGSAQGKEAIERRLTGEESLRLHALCKAAIEGPCFGPSPITISLNARAKRNAWMKLGSITPEVAMEQYVALLTERVPDWISDNPSGQVMNVQGFDTSGSVAAENKEPASRSCADSSVERYN